MCSSCNSDLEIRRHSLAHVLAQAVQRLYPDAKKTIGPAVENGFYFDFDFGDVSVTEADLPKLEKEMRRILAGGQKFVRYELSKEDALKKAVEIEKNPYKAELIEDLAKEGASVFSYYKNVDQKGEDAYEDLCRGPHVEHAGQIPQDCFKLWKIAGAYWRGDSSKKMLTRIYGLAFATKGELDAYVTMLEEAKRRDHRVLGTSLELFTIVPEVGAGLPIYLPKGAKLRQVLERYMTQEAEGAGYQYVYTPHIAKSDLFAKSGHLSHYADGMFAPIQMVNLKGEGVKDGEKPEQFYLKPMNCPMHHQVYLNKPRSYRDLPMRLMEYGTVYRYEESGTLTGLIRVRGFTQNDAHVYCARPQLLEVVGEALRRFLRAYEALGIRDYKIRFSLPDFAGNPEKYGEETQEWRESVEAMRSVLDQLQVEYFDAPNEAAFYGPKIDFQVRNVNGKEDTLSTIQVDFSIAPKFGIEYTDSDGSKRAPAIIHMALMGSVERFIAFLIEMNAGRFPFWVAPEQVRILTVTDAALPYAREVCDVLRGVVLMKPLRHNELRFSIEDRNETLGKKIRQAEMDKVPVMLIVGEKDAQERTVSLRSKDGESKIPLADLGRHLESL